MDKTTCFCRKMLCCGFFNFFFVKSKYYRQHLLATCRTTLLLFKFQCFVARITTPGSNLSWKIFQCCKLQHVAANCNTEICCTRSCCGDGNTGNKAFPLGNQQCCATNCNVMLPIVLGFYFSYVSFQKVSRALLVTTLLSSFTLTVESFCLILVIKELPVNHGL